MKNKVYLMCQHKNTSKPIENLYKSLFEPNWRSMLGTKISISLENNSFADSFMHLQWMREHKEDYREVGENERGIRLQTS